jgi:hypothetical protein
VWLKLELHPENLVYKSSYISMVLQVKRILCGHDAPLLFSGIAIGVSCSTMICLFFVLL